MRARNVKSERMTQKTGLHVLASILASILVACSAALIPVAASSTNSKPLLCVDARASGADNGRCWNGAYTDLQAALDHAEESGGRVTEIWVAAGTYRPTK